MVYAAWHCIPLSYFFCIVVLYYCHYLCSWFLAVWLQCSINLNLNLNLFDLRSNDVRLQSDTYVARTLLLLKRPYIVTAMSLPVPTRLVAKYYLYLRSLHHDIPFHKRGKRPHDPPVGWSQMPNIVAGVSQTNRNMRHRFCPGLWNRSGLYTSKLLNWCKYQCHKNRHTWLRNRAPLS